MKGLLAGLVELDRTVECELDRLESLDASSTSYFAKGLSSTRFPNRCPAFKSSV